MSTTPTLFVKCPICNRQVAWTIVETFKPFCSERCKLIDLGEWFTEDKKIAGEPFIQTQDPNENI